MAHNRKSLVMAFAAVVLVLSLTGIVFDRPEAPEAKTRIQADEVWGEILVDQIRVEWVQGANGAWRRASPGTVAPPQLISSPAFRVEAAD